MLICIDMRCYSRSFDILLLNQSTLIDKDSVVCAEFVDINSDCLSGTCVCMMVMIHVLLCPDYYRSTVEYTLF